MTLFNAVVTPRLTALFIADNISDKIGYVGQRYKPLTFEKNLKEIREI